MAKDKAKERAERIEARLLEGLAKNPGGLTKSEILVEIFRNGYPARDVWAVVRKLVAEGKIVVQHGTRPVVHQQKVTVLKLADGV